MPALRDNKGKAELSYILELPRTMRALAKVFAQGAIKYARGNWKLGGKPDQEYLDAALRHMEQFVNVGPYDPDIGTIHLANAIWNLAALIELNHPELESVDPAFEQSAFEHRYSGEAAPVAVRQTERQRALASAEAQIARHRSLQQSGSCGL